MARKAIDKITSSRSAEADKQAADLVSTRMELESTRAKLDASLSRRKVCVNYVEEWAVMNGLCVYSCK